MLRAYLLMECLQKRFRDHSLDLVLPITSSRMLGLKQILSFMTYAPLAGSEHAKLPFLFKFLKILAVKSCESCKAIVGF